MAGSESLSAPVQADPKPNPRIAILLEASEAAAANTLNVDSLMSELCRLVRKIIDFELYSVLVPGDAGELRIAHSFGYAPEVVRGLRVKPGEGLTGRAAKSLTTVRADDVRREPDYVQVVDSVRSELAVPLVARDRLVAVLDLQSADVGAFDSRVSDLLELVASRFSLALDVAQLYHSQAEQHSILTTLRQIAHEFSSILDLGDLLQEISTLVRTLIRYDVLAIYLKAPKQSLLRHYFGVKFQERVQWRDIEVGEGLVGSAAQTLEPVLVADTSMDPRYIASMPGIRSEVAVPLILKNQLIGVLDLECVRIGALTNRDMNTLMLLAPQISAAIENARLYEETARNKARLERDLVAARALQSHMLPVGSLSGPGIEIVARNEPAAVVSGDFYDFYERDHAIGVLNVDVSGKGAAAALYAALASGLFRTAADSGLSPGETLGRVNNSLHDRKIETRFLTAHVLAWDALRGRLVMSGAGMPFPYVCRGGALETVRLEGLPLGLFRDIRYDEVTLDLGPGDSVVTLSDGFSESLNERGESYGDERLGDVLRGTWSAPASVMLDRLFDGVRGFCDGCPPDDDRTAVILRVTE
ncbi:MAG: SpoIIE family protein phosphatase [Bryobacterales bacterium]|nr:SpoIIE family protein phosphatase [Bryobacterales bacterium]MDE0628690.1 SpoIIE family protein phosphatase [Bryobacterales bacterium]